MQNSELEKKIEQIVEPLLEGTELELVDVEYVREGQWYLRIFLDKEGGIEIEDCQSVSEKLAQILDEKDMIKGKYFLEVSSPGLDRKLVKDKDFIRYKGFSVDVKIKGESKIIVGELGEVSEDVLELFINKKAEKIDRKTIDVVKLHISF